MQRVSKSELNFALLRVIFRWVAHNIEYDVDSFFGGRMNASGSSPETVLKTGKAVCEGVSSSEI
jgi:transglutaminase-like putative cysteine protease